MTSPKSVLEQALSLPPDERAGLARDLIASLDDASDDGADEAWLEEAERRQREAAADPTQLEDWTVVRARIAARLRASRT
jgi:putative addiction module component (TIGR02574 family)